MTTLTNSAISKIRDWSDSFRNTAAGQGLIDAANRSPYLCSQLNEFFAVGGSLRAPPNSSASAARNEATLVLNVGTTLANSYSTSALGLDQMSTVIAHELGHVLSPGGLTTGTVIPTKAVESSHRAEGVGLSSEMIVSYQLGLGGNGRYSYSDQGNLKQPPGAMAQQFLQQISLEADSPMLGTLSTPAATGNDAINDPAHATNVGLLKSQLDVIARTNNSIGVGYLSGPCTQGGILGALDSINGGSGTAAHLLSKQKLLVGRTHSSFDQRILAVPAKNETYWEQAA